MGITGVGSSYNFVYNTKTGKLSTKDGSKNEFVDFCNGDVKGEDTESLNHFDAHTRYQFQRMLYVYGTGMTGQNPFENDEEVVECWLLNIVRIELQFLGRFFCSGTIKKSI